MKKLNLNLETLVVESFGTDAGAEKRGTVRANSCTEQYGTYCGTCYENTCVTCVNTCQNSGCTRNVPCWE
ncbi:MAG TPA: hypothetical protein VF092_02035 [Longimicrobium sp.]